MLKSFYRNNEKSISRKEGDKTMYKEIQNFTKVITTEFAEAVKEGKSYHLTPDPSPYRGEGRKLTSPHPQPFSLMRRREQSAAFTLAETLITVVILGILAAILVPNLIKNQVENANRTKVKKAMAAYEKAINMMIIENDIKSTENLRELGQDNCQYTREYFKTVQDSTNNCLFKTADRVWWNISDLTNPIIILKDDLKDEPLSLLQVMAKDLSNMIVFAMIGRFDDLGALRVNDNAYEQGLNNNVANQKYMKKLWYTLTLSDSMLTTFDKCKINKKSTCTINVAGKDIDYTLIPVTQEQCDTRTYLTQTHQSCVYEPYYVYDFGMVTKAMAQAGCEGSVYGDSCSYDYWNAAMKHCKSQGGHLATVAEVKATGYNDKWYWTSEIRNNDGTNIYTVWKGSTANYSPNSSNGYRILCVGD